MAHLSCSWGPGIAISVDIAPAGGDGKRVDKLVLTRQSLNTGESVTGEGLVLVLVPLPLTPFCVQPSTNHLVNFC